MYFLYTRVRCQIVKFMWRLSHDLIMTCSIIKQCTMIQTNKQVHRSAVRPKIRLHGAVEMADVLV